MSELTKKQWAELKRKYPAAEYKRMRDRDKESRAIDARLAAARQKEEEVRLANYIVREYGSVEKMIESELARRARQVKR